MDGLCKKTAVMDTKQIQSTYQTIVRLLLLGRLKQAFDNIDKLIANLPGWELGEQFSALKQNYRYLLKYYIDGAEDPERLTVYNKIVAKLLSLSAVVREGLFVQHSTNFVYTQKRYFYDNRKFPDAGSLRQSLQDCRARMEFLHNDKAEHREEIEHIEADYEALLPELFGLFWLTTHLRQDDKTLFAHLIRGNCGGLPEKSLIVSALTLNLWRMFDEEKLLMLFDCCEADDPSVKQRALVGLCFVLSKYDRFQNYFPKVRNRLVLLADNEHTLANFRNIIRQIISTAETEKISKRLREEILPEITRLSSGQIGKTDVESMLDFDEWGEGNPHWEKLIEESGVSDKIRELSELQMEGADVYMSAFSTLKSFSFFNQVSNWFLPFIPQHSAVKKLFADGSRSLLGTFVNSRIMCNSDLYSFCISMLRMPPSQHDMLNQSFKAELEQMEEMQKDEAMLSPETESKNISRQYIQDLFRFFRVHPYRSEFDDMFHWALELHGTHLFGILSTEGRFKVDIAEYYFSKQLYPQALEVFDQLVKEQKPSAGLYQKIGFANQKISLIDKALDAYLKADIICPDDLWTVKKIALCYRLLGKSKKSLEYYLRADFLNPGEPLTRMHIAALHLQEGNIKEALGLYFKLDAEHDEDIRIQRAVLWALFVSGNLEQAAVYVKKILASQNPSFRDYVNAGHVSWAMKDRKTALSHYKKSLRMQSGKWNALQDTLQQDFRHLQNNGINPDELPLMLDEILFD